MKEYAKIETPFERAMDGTKKLIPNAWRNEAVEALKNNKWIWTEKIDGTNISIVWDGHHVEYHGRTERANIPSHLLNMLISIFGTNEAEELFEQKFGEQEVILFGEGFGPKIQKGGENYSDTPKFALFDVYINGVWLKRESIEEIATAFGCDVVPICGEGTIEEAIDYVKSIPDSAFGTAKIEGIVCKPTYEFLDRLGRRVMVKIKVCDFKE